MILGCPQQTTVSPGDVLTLHVSTDAPSFRADFSRQEAAIVPLFSSDWLPGHLSPMPIDGGTDCAWPAYAFPIPADWPTGAYSVTFVGGDGHGGLNPAPTPPPPAPNANADQADVFGAFFVVRPAAPSAAILYKVPLFTYHAYNTTGGSSLYEQNGAHTVTFLRPGGGIGAYYRHGDVPDAHDPASRRQTFAHWDAKFISWLYANQVYPDFCTDLDVHQNPHLLDRYRLMLSVGHDEYWSQAERDAVEAFIARGGNVAFFSGNICWWRVEVIDNDTGLRCEKGQVAPAADWVPAQWWSDVGEPENSMTGVSLRSGGGWWNGPRVDVPYTVYRTRHWAFEGTGVKDGDRLGAGQRLIGYEADGAQMAWRDGLPEPTGVDGTPLDFAILGVGLLANNGWSFEFEDLYPRRAATMGSYTYVGTVFTAATTDWARVLAGGDSGIARITCNVLYNLGQLTAFPAGSVVSVAGYYAAGDEFQHVIVATTDGAIHEVFWKPQDPANPGVRTDQLTAFPAGTVVSVAGYYADATGYQHAITAPTIGGVCQTTFRSQ
jgi:hypothetical protein